MKCCNEDKQKIRSITEKKDLVNRLNRIEGQIKGIKQMVESDRYCDDVLIQISAANNSLKNLGLLMLKNHMHTCMKDEILSGNDKIIDEVSTIISRFK